MAALPELYPPIAPYTSGKLTRGDIHQMYWEESGHSKGLPVLFLHGGPGAGASPTHRRFFDPNFYRIVIFDQRGAGRSTPLGELRENSTLHLIDDIEILRRHLGIERWLIFGGSWGSTLALAYGQTHPERCLGFILRGLFLCRKQEIDWFLYGARHIFPEAWERLVEPIPEAERSDLLHAYYRRLIDPDAEFHLPAARRWSQYEGACSTLLPSKETIAHFGDDRVALGLARMEAHYFITDRFLHEHDFIAGIERIRHHPATLVQGRYDIVCPIVTANEIAAAWPEATYQIIANCGHSALEPGIRAALLKATDHFRDQHTGKNLTLPVD